MPSFELVKQYGPWAIGWICFFWAMAMWQKDARRREDRLHKTLENNTQAMTILSERLKRNAD